MQGNSTMSRKWRRLESIRERSKWRKREVALKAVGNGQKRSKYNYSNPNTFLIIHCHQFSWLLSSFPTDACPHISLHSLLTAHIRRRWWISVASNTHISFPIISKEIKSFETVATMARIKINIIGRKPSPPCEWLERYTARSASADVLDNVITVADDGIPF